MEILEPQASFPEQVTASLHISSPLKIVYHGDMETGKIPRVQELSTDVIHPGF